jgi:hypothetical protein
MHKPTYTHPIRILSGSTRHDSTSGSNSWFHLADTTFLCADERTAG